MGQASSSCLTPYPSQEDADALKVGCWDLFCGRQWVLGSGTLRGVCRHGVGAARTSLGAGVLLETGRVLQWCRAAGKSWGDAGLSTANISPCAQCQLLPPVPARLDAQGPGQSPLPSHGFQQSCEAMVLPAHCCPSLAPALLLHRPGPAHGCASAAGLRLCPAPLIPIPKAPKTHLHPQQPVAMCPVLCGSWP